MNTSNIFERLKEIRKELRLNQAQIAEICGVSRETWSRYESGKLSPGMEVLAAIAAAGADVQYILTGTRTQSPDTGPLSPRVAALLDNYQNTDEQGRKIIEATASAAAQPEKTASKNSG